MLLCRRASDSLVTDYQREVDKGELTALANSKKSSRFVEAIARNVSFSKFAIRVCLALSTSR